MNPLQPGLRYIFHPQAESPAVKAFGILTANNFPIPAPLGEILYHLGLTTLSAIQDFLYPQLSMLPSPDCMKGMQQAVACIVDIVQARKPIFIHGDYDVDGISATALLSLFFRELGIPSVCYIPNRLEESYGLSVSSINHLVNWPDTTIKGGGLLTVDCGITAVDEVAYAKELGLRVIITDHHEPKTVLPDAEAILNPKQQGCGFPFPLLSGVGVAFFLIMALRKAFVENGFVASGAGLNLKKYLDLVALGTVADVVPLVGVNRILVRAGLEVLSLKDRLGVFSLCDTCGLAGREILAEDIAFKLAPRINAAGRLGMPQIGLDLLSVNDREQAGLAAQALDQINSQRKQLELIVLAAVEAKCNEQVREGAFGLVVYQENCHPGVLGILASRMVDRFCRPVIIFTDDTTSSGHYLKGSGRSVSGVNLLQIAEQCPLWIEHFGGHAMAIGLTIKKSNIYNFVQLFQQRTAAWKAILGRGKGVVVDFHFMDNKFLTKEFAQALQMLQPFGEGNPEPQFLLSGTQFAQPKNVKGHLMFQIRANETLFPGIGFHLADSISNFQDSVDLVFQFKRSWFRGVGRNQIQALHIIPC